MQEASLRELVDAWARTDMTVDALETIQELLKKEVHARLADRGSSEFRGDLGHVTRRQYVETRLDYEDAKATIEAHPDLHLADHMKQNDKHFTFCQIHETDPLQIHRVVEATLQEAAIGPHDLANHGMKEGA